MNRQPVKNIEVDQELEENKENMLFSLFSIPTEEKVAYLLAAKTDGIRLSKFIHFILKSYLEKDENVLATLYKYIEQKKTAKRKDKKKVNIVKEYHSIIKEYEKIYVPFEDQIETDLQDTIYNNS